MPYTAQHYIKYSKIIPYYIPWLTSERLLDYQIMDLHLEHTPFPKSAVAVISFWTNHNGYQRCYLNDRAERIDYGNCSSLLKGVVDKWLKDLKEESHSLML
jgi:hypothetical protein